MKTKLVQFNDGDGIFKSGSFPIYRESMGKEIVLDDASGETLSERCPLSIRRPAQPL